MKISVSTLNLIKEESNLLLLDSTNIDYLHIDIMDNYFVPNYISQFDFINKSLTKLTKPLDIHLMVNDVKGYIDLYSTLLPEYLTFHLENGNVIETINYIKSKNIKVGLSIKPDTDIVELMPYLDLIDLVLVMSVEPGYGGQPFIEEVVLKIKKLKELQNKYKYVIEVDGGITETNLDLVKESDIIVVGSFITKGDNYQEKINIIKSNFKDQI